MKPRFFVVPQDQAKELVGGLFEDPYGRDHWCLLERLDDGSHRLVGTDGGEPEDQLLIRDWNWVVTELNAQADQIAKLKRVAKTAEDIYDKFGLGFHSDESSDELGLALDSLNINGSYRRINGVLTEEND